MSARLQALALRKESLLTRSALCRLQLQRATHHVRHAPQSGLPRVVRAVVLAGRIVRLARTAHAFAFPGNGTRK